MPFDAAPRLSPAQRDAARGKLATMRREALAAVLARYTRDALGDGRIPTKLAYEALFRAAMRSALCLQGWRWWQADEAAAATVAACLNLLQASRPSWADGQPDALGYSGVVIERTRCANCGAPIPEERKKFCSDRCAIIFNNRLHRLQAADAAVAYDMAARQAGL